MHSRPSRRHPNKQPPLLLQLPPGRRSPHHLLFFPAPAVPARRRMAAIRARHPPQWGRTHFEPFVRLDRADPRKVRASAPRSRRACSPCAPSNRTPAVHVLPGAAHAGARSEEHTSELQSRRDLVCRLLLEKKKKKKIVLRIGISTTHRCGQR